MEKLLRERILGGAMKGHLDNTVKKEVRTKEL